MYYFCYLGTFIQMALQNFLDLVALKLLSRSNSAFRIGTSLSMQNQWYNDRPSWIALASPQDLENAARHNPIVKAAINLLATSSSNGKKQAIDIKTGGVIPWTENDPAIKKAYQLLVQRANPLQSAKEFAHQGTFFLKVFGNRYVRILMPIGRDKKVDILNIQALYNLPSQFIDVRSTGKLYDQFELSGVVDKYALTNYNPIVEYLPEEVIHFNEVNISSDVPTIMGVSKLEAIKMPITNTQKAFEAMNTILSSRGMQGIISPKNRDGMGISVPMTDTEKEDVDKTFKKDYGLLNNQNPFLISPISMDYIKTTMNSQEMGIYEEFSNNAILIGNEFGVPPELIKTYIQGATYENQIQSVKRLYQDTTIPMVEDEDSYWSFRLDTFKYGFEIKTSWDHIPALQGAIKDNAIALEKNVKAAIASYDDNLITWNQTLLIMRLPPVKDGDLLKHERKIGDGEG